MAWVSVPNHHDGENFSILMQQEKGAEIFSAWILMLQVASKCTPRGTLIRGDGTPHTDRSLSAKCRCPVTWFTLAFEYLEKNTDWLETKDETHGRHQAVTKPSPSYQASAEGGNGKERRGGEGKEGLPAPFPEAEIPSWKAFWEYCQSVHCGLAAEFYARDKWEAANADEWKKKSDWRSYARRCKGWWQQDGSPMQPKMKNGKLNPATRPVGGHL